jgi:hypothetical protein
MTLKQFEEALDRCGGDLSVWPAAERAAGEQLLAASTSARQLLRLQQQVDAALADYPEIEPSADLRRRVAEIPFRHEPVRIGWRHVWRPALAALSLATVGILVGFTTTDSQAQTATLEAEEISKLMLSTVWIEEEP